MKVCPFCAEEVQDSAIVCKHCGRQLDEAAVARVTGRHQAAQPTKRPSVPTLVIGGTAAVAAALFLLNSFESAQHVQQAGAPVVHIPPPPPPKVITLASNSDIDVSAGSIERLDWAVPESQPHCHLTGRIEVTSGGSKDVQVFVTTADEYKNLQNGHEAKTLLHTDKTTVVNLDVFAETPGPMVLAIGNTFSVFTGKRVQLRDVKATCT